MLPTPWRSFRCQSANFFSLFFHSLLPVFEALMYDVQCIFMSQSNNARRGVKCDLCTLGIVSCFGTFSMDIWRWSWSCSLWGHDEAWQQWHSVVMSGCWSILIMGGGNLVTLAVIRRGMLELFDHFVIWSSATIMTYGGIRSFVLCGVAGVDVSIQLTGVICLSWVWVVRLGWCSSPIGRCCLLYHQVWILFKF